MSENPVISVNEFPVNFAISIPPCDCCIGYGRGDARQINRVLIPGPLFFHRLFLKGWREFDLNVTGLEKLSSLVARLAFVQSIIFTLQAIDDQFGNLPSLFALGVIRCSFLAFLDKNSVISRL